MFVTCFQNQTNELNKELHAKERLEGELKELSNNLEEKDTEVTNLKLQLIQAQHSVGNLETDVKNLKVLNEKQTSSKTKTVVFM
jgi:predicted  nucleic acid-binding Zn-ribbon protein